MGPLQYSLWDIGSKNSEWNESWAWRDVWECCCARTCPVCVSNVCSPCCSTKYCQLQTVKEDGGRGRYRQFQPRSQHFHFVSLEAKSGTLSNLHLWMAMKRLALFCATWKPCPHTAVSKSLTTNQRPPSALHPPPCWHHFFAAFGQRLFRHCGVWPGAAAGVLSSGLPGVFQSNQREGPPNAYSNLKGNTCIPKIRQIDGDKWFIQRNRIPRNSPPALLPFFEKYETRNWEKKFKRKPSKLMHSWVCHGLATFQLLQGQPCRHHRRWHSNVLQATVHHSFWSALEKDHNSDGHPQTVGLTLTS